LRADNLARFADGAVNAPRYPDLAAFEAARGSAERERHRARAMAEADARDWARMARDLDRQGATHSAAVARRTAADIAPWLAAVLNPTPATPTTPTSRAAERRAREAAHLERTMARSIEPGAA
jgi:hypothetical protein